MNAEHELSYAEAQADVPCGELECGFARIAVKVPTKTWTEWHPFGDTVAGETLTEITDWADVKYFFNDEEITREALVTAVGEEAVADIEEKAL